MVVVSPARMGCWALTLLTRPPRACASQLLDLRPHHPYRGGRGRWYHLWKSEQVLIGYLGAILSTMDATSLLLFSLSLMARLPPLIIDSSFNCRVVSA